MVSRSGRVPIPAAEVVVSQDAEQVVKTLSADDGNFVVENLPDGDYLLTGADEVTFEEPSDGGYAHFKDGVLTLHTTLMREKAKYAIYTIWHLL